MNKYEEAFSHLRCRVMNILDKDDSRYQEESELINKSKMTVYEACEKAEKYDELKAENEQLKRLLDIYESHACYVITSDNKCRLEVFKADMTEEEVAEMARWVEEHLLY